MKAAVSLLALCLASSVPVQAEGVPEEDSQRWHRLVGVLQYLESDYPGALASGSQFELEEQRSFAGEAVEIAQGLGPRGEGLVSRLEAVSAQVQARGNPAEVSQACRALLEEVVATGGLSRAPRAAPDLQRGAEVYAESCAACHGGDGRAKGEIAAAMTPKPTDFHGAGVMARLTPYKVFNATSFGVLGTPMPGFPTLTEADRWAVSFYVFTLRQPRCEGGAVPGASLDLLATSSDSELARRFSPDALACLRRDLPSPGGLDRLLLASAHVEQAVRSAERGDYPVAKAALLDAYLKGLEPSEPLLRSRDAALVQRLEEVFLRARLFAENKDPRAVQESQLLLALLEKAEKPGNGAGALSVLFQAMLILVREGFEAVVVIAALLAVLKKMNATSQARTVHAGWISASVVGALAFLFARSALAGANREWMEGLVALAAVGMLLYAALWLNARANTRKFMGKLRAGMQEALGKGSAAGLFFISFSALLRESLETALFLQGLAIDSPQGVAFGAAAGLVFLLGLVAMVRKVGFVLPMKQLFTASTVLLYATAVVLLGKGLHALQEVGAVPLHPVPFVTVDFLGVFPDALPLCAQAALAMAPAIYWILRGKPASVAPVG